LHYPEFGCATQSNLAGMVANARDLQRPQDEQPRSAERRSQSWSKYIAPEQPESTAETKAKAVETTKKQ
jgi:pilus assembly protein CpaD